METSMFTYLLNPSQIKLRIQDRKSIYALDRNMLEFIFREWVNFVNTIIVDTPLSSNES